MRAAFVSVVVLTLCVLSVSAQEHPSFDGTWALDSARSTILDVRGEPVTVFVFNQSFTIRQTPDSVRVTMQPLLGDTRPNDDCGRNMVYRLDGEPTENCMGADHQRTQSTAAWSGTTLLLTIGTVERNGTIEPWQLHFTLTLNDDGTLRAEAPWGQLVYKRVQ